MLNNRPFLTAQWRYLMILNYEVEPALLSSLLPDGVELDLWDGKALVSMVGFRFINTRLMGIPVPFHTNFDEVNLRFYVRQRHETGEEARRGVVFVKEIVPRPWIAQVARLVYGENYIALPMRHIIEEKGGRLCPEGLVEYIWRYQGRLNRLGGLALGDPQPLTPGSEAEFITEHYWGYTRRSKNKTGVYQVMHPAWRIWNVAQPYLLCDVTALYGKAFEPFLHRPPRSAFLAEGSPVAVYPGSTMKSRPARAQHKK